MSVAREVGWITPKGIRENVLAPEAQFHSLSFAHQLFGPEETHEDIDCQFHCDGAAAVEQNVPRGAGAVRKEGLVPLIGAGYQGGSQNR